MAATDMRSDGGTQTEDQDAWMGYNHVHPAVGQVVEVPLSKVRT